MPKDGNSYEKELKCSFCGRSKDSVGKLIAGPGVYICDECVELCNSIIEEQTEEAARNAKQNEKTFVLPKPIEIKEKLDEYVIGQEEAKIVLSVAVYNH